LDLTESRDYRDTLEKLNAVRARLDELTKLRQEIEGKLSEKQREDRKRALQEAGEAAFETGRVSLSSELEQKLRGDLKTLNSETTVHQKAAQIGERKLAATRSRIVAEVTAKYLDEYRSRSIAVILASVKLGEAIAAEASFVEGFTSADIPVGFPRVTVVDASFDLNHADSVPCRLIQEAVQAGLLTGREDWLKATDWNGAKAVAREKAAARNIKLIRKSRK
jgi:hypothetical protein